MARQMFNFGAGPAMLPREVLGQARDELLDCHGSGVSVMEMSHRGREFTEIASQAEADLRELMAIPDNYHVLFLQGGATSQFAMVPINLLRGRSKADYVNTGQWSKKAIAEAKRFCAVNIAASGESGNFTSIPPFETWKRDPGAAYLHYTTNETIGGVEFHWIPDAGSVPLVTDMSSDILSRPVDVSCFGLIYAGAQKNIGPAGLAIVIVRKDLVGEVLPGMPTMLDYRIFAENASMYNTPPTFAIYVAGLTLKWLKKIGGLAAIERRNMAKASLLYNFLDAAEFYACPIAKPDRSRMNVPFTLKDTRLDELFLKQADVRGLLQLKGHRSVGGMRASLYNAMPVEGVRALVMFLQDFEKEHA
jgi:phosphoserine aminotransferase